MARGYLVVASLTAGASCALGQNCPEQWIPVVGVAGTDNQIRATAIWDPDDAGPMAPELVIGGEFTVVGQTVARGAARWDGTRWLGMGSTRARIFAFAEFDADGPGGASRDLLCSGAFGPDGAEPFGLARWAGAEWELVTATPVFPHVMSVFDPDGPGPVHPKLIAGGYSASTDPGPMRGVAQWDGATWTPLGTGLSQQIPESTQIHALVVVDYDGPGPELAKLIVGGDFTRAGSLSVGGIAAWDGQSWSALGAGLSNQSGARPIVRSMIPFDLDGPGPASVRLIASGSFDRAGGLPVSYVGVWDGASWSALTASNPIGFPLLFTGDSDGGGSLQESLLAIAYPVPPMPPAPASIQRWTGSGWTPLGEQLGDDPTRLTEFRPGGGEPVLVATGDFAGRGLARNLAVWDGAGWDFIDGPALAMDYGMVAIDPDGAGPLPEELVTDGVYQDGSGGRLEGPLAFDGRSWRVIGGTEILGPFTVLDLDGPGPQADRLIGYRASPNVFVAWDGVSWTPISSAGWTNPGVFDFDGSGPQPPRLISGFPEFGGPTPGYRTAAWDGSTWSSFGEQLVSMVSHEYTNLRKFLAFDPDGSGPEPESLYVAGYFHQAGQTAVRHVARWDGAAWRDLDTSMFGWNDSVYELAVFDLDGTGPNPERLLVASTQGLLVWDGEQWVAEASLAPIPRAFAQLDRDAAGPLPTELFVLTRDSRIFRWASPTWISFAEGLSHAGNNTVGLADAISGWQPQGLAPRLAVSGGFLLAGPHAAPKLALYGCPGPPCYVNCDESTSAPVLNAADFACFLQRFAAGDLYVNCDGSTVHPMLNVADFTCFVRRFAAGCP